MNAERCVHVHWANGPKGMCRRRNAHVLSDRCCQCPGVQASHTASPMRQSFTSPLPDNIRFWPWMQSPLLPPLGGASRQNEQDQQTDRHDCDACCVRRGGKAVEVALDSLPSPLNYLRVVGPSGLVPWSPPRSQAGGDSAAHHARRR